jgi:hypothetical protein
MSRRLYTVYGVTFLFQIRSLYLFRVDALLRSIRQYKCAPVLVVVMSTTLQHSTAQSRVPVPGSYSCSKSIVSRLVVLTTVKTRARSPVLHYQYSQL